MTDLIVRIFNKNFNKIQANEIDDYLTCAAVKSYLFYDETSPLTQIYGKHTNLETIDSNEMKLYIKDFIKIDTKLIQLIQNYKEFTIKLRIKIILYAFLLKTTFVSVICLIVFINNTKIKYGLLKTSITLISEVAVMLVLILLLSFLFKTSKNEKK